MDCGGVVCCIESAGALCTDGAAEGGREGGLDGACCDDGGPPLDCGGVGCSEGVSEPLSEGAARPDGIDGDVVPPLPDESCAM